MPGNHFDDSLEKTFDVLPSGKQRSKFSDVTEQIEMVVVFFIRHSGYLEPPKKQYANLRVFWA